MGTKANPGVFDCHEAADDHEPIFTLRAEDPTSDSFVEMWAAMRTGDMAEARQAFQRAMFRAVARNAVQPANPNKVAEAGRCASDMRRWRQNPRLLQMEGERRLRDQHRPPAPPAPRLGPPRIPCSACLARDASECGLKRATGAPCLRYGD